MYKGPRVVEKVMKNNNLDDSYLQASSLGDDTSSVQNDSATTTNNETFTQKQVDKMRTATAEDF